MSATAEKIIHEVNFGEKIKVVLTELLFPSSAFLGKGNFIVHYLEKDEESLEYTHNNVDKALEDFNFLTKIAKKEFIKQYARKRVC